MAKVLHLQKHVMPQLGGDADRRLCREILCRRRADKADDAEQHEQPAHREDVRLVRIFDPDIDKALDDERYKQLKGRLQHLEERREHCLFFELCKVSENPFHAEISVLMN